MKKIMFKDKYGLTDAVLLGKKTMTRRVFTEEVYGELNIGNNPTRIDETQLGINSVYIRSHFPKYEIGEVIAIAQSYATFNEAYNLSLLSLLNAKEPKGWHNKMFVYAELMPHQIQITGIKIERLQDISDDDCIKEGIIDMMSRPKKYAYKYNGNYYMHKSPREAFSKLINKISGKGTWERNPYVFVYEFKLVK